MTRLLLWERRVLFVGAAEAAMLLLRFPTRTRARFRYPHDPRNATLCVWIQTSSPVAVLRPCAGAVDPKPDDRTWSPSRVATGDRCSPIPTSQWPPRVHSPKRACGAHRSSSAGCSCPTTGMVWWNSRIPKRFPRSSRGSRPCPHVPSILLLISGFPYGQAASTTAQFAVMRTALPSRTISSGIQSAPDCAHASVTIRSGMRRGYEASRRQASRLPPLPQEARYVAIRHCILVGAGEAAIRRCFLWERRKPRFAIASLWERRKPRCSFSPSAARHAPCHCDRPSRGTCRRC